LAQIIRVKRMKNRKFNLAPLSIIFILSLLLAACGGDSADTAVDDSTNSEQEQEAPSEVTVANPFTGKSGGLDNPVIVVKVDNVNPARPQWGLSEADLVFVEEVEAGLTRIAAVYSTNLPQKVGPVRSARISDLEIMEQFGTPAFAYSGAQSALLPEIAAANIVEVAHGSSGGVYNRETTKNAPHNLTINLSQLAPTLVGVSTPKDIGLTFDATAATGGTATSTFNAKWPASRVGAEWDSVNSGWVIALDSAPALDANTNAPIFANNVVIQYVKQGDSIYKDSGGNFTPLIETVGSGTAVVLRDGQRFEVTWSRPSATSGTTYSRAGAPMAFVPGQTWILYVPQEYAVTFEP
jgi:hypothetical protein